MLQALQQRYGRRGFRVIGFPCNDFADEEPDDLATIKAFCTREYGVTYELMGKVRIRDKSKMHPLYRWLTSTGPDPGPVRWNFEKFLIDGNGNLIGRWSPDTPPDSKPVTRAIEGSLR